MRSRGTLLLLALAATAAVRPAFTVRMHSVDTPAPAAAWPADLEGAPLVPSRLWPVETRLAAEFPGTVAAFELDGKRIVMRRIAQPTRKLHPVEGCLRAGGYTVQPRPAWRHPESGLWGVVLARKGGQSLRAREMIRSAGGAHTWSDVSAWYWDAVLHPERGPWLAITVIEAAELTDDEGS